MHGNRELISQALANLVDNAIKYAAPNNATLAPEQSPLNGAQPEIVVKAAGEGDRILLTVADTGPGIPADDRSRAVERFVRLEQSRSLPGSGLGLESRQCRRPPARRRVASGRQHARLAVGAGAAARRLRRSCQSSAGIPAKGCRFPSCDSGPAVTNSRDGGICNDGG